MFYFLKLAWRAARSTPGLSAMVVVGLSLGMMLAILGLSIGLRSWVKLGFDGESFHVPGLENLYHVQINNWDQSYTYNWTHAHGYVAFGEEFTEPLHLTWKDARALLESDLPTFQARSFASRPAIWPEGGEPIKAQARACDAAFFPLFKVPLAEGRFWTREDESGEATLAVLSQEGNEKWFQGGGLGKTLQLSGKTYRVIGVLDEYRPYPKYQNSHASFYVEPIADLYIPLTTAMASRLEPHPVPFAWRGGVSSWEEWLDSEENWVEFWVELSPEKVGAYRGWLRRYIDAARQSGRFARDTRAPLTTASEWGRSLKTPYAQSGPMWIMNLLFILGFSINFSCMLLTRFLERSAQVGVRRALGATRNSIFMQHLVESLSYCALISLFGILGGGVLLLALDHYLYAFGSFSDMGCLASVVVVMIASGVMSLASIFPAWMICRVKPAVHLKMKM